MGYFEAAVVVYLRGLFYPEGFSFPLKIAPSGHIITELFREAATIIMLVTVAALAARKFWERFGYFIILFGVWDIFYYVWLKVLIDWPSSLFDWDILFLIPLPWISPVIAPVLVALLMIVIGLSITSLFHKGYEFKPTKVTWGLAVSGTFLILLSFMIDVDAGINQKMPEPYLYRLLFPGLFFYCIAYLHTHREVLKKVKKPDTL